MKRLYTYLRFLLTKLPRRGSDAGVHVEDEIELQYYRLQKICNGQRPIIYYEKMSLLR